MADRTKLDLGAENALNRLMDTELTPMEEALFKSWAVANQIDKPDKADDLIDYRGLYKLTGGKVLPYGQLRAMTERANNEEKLARSMQDRMFDSVQSEQDKADQFHKEQRQDVTHKQKLESDHMALAKAPYEVEKQRIASQTKQYDVQGKQAQAVTQKHKADETLFNTMLQMYAPQPEPAVEPTGAGDEYEGS